MENSPNKVKDFLVANKTFVAVLVIGVPILLFTAAGMFDKYMKIRPGGGVYLPGAPATMDSSFGYAKESSRNSASVVPPMPIPGAPASTQTVPSDKKIIRNGTLHLLVKSADVTAVSIENIAEANGGFVENSNIYEYSEGVKSGNISIRIPSARFTEVMEAVKKLAVKVTNEGVSSTDVTAQYVDLEAQIRNLRAEETQYQLVMTKAVRIDEILQVSSKLADVRGRIDRTEGQLNLLARQVSMSTININLTAEPEVRVLGIVWRPLTVVKQAFKSMLTDLIGFINWLIKFLFHLPVYILKLATAVIIVFVSFKIILWLKRLIFG
jgi:hypothetical protein